MGGWLDQLKIKLTSVPAGLKLELGTELGNIHLKFYCEENVQLLTTLAMSNHMKMCYVS